MSCLIEDVVDFNDNDYYYTYLRDKEIVKWFKKLPPLNQSLGIDIETYAKQGVEHVEAGLNPRLSRIRTIQIYDGLSTYILDFLTTDGGYYLTNPWVAEQVYKLLTTHKLVAHNAIFETSHFQHLFYSHYGIMRPLKIRCTMNAFRLIMCACEETYDVIKERIGSLEYVSNFVLNKAPPKEQQMSDWSKPKLTKKQLDYCCLDAVLPLEILHKIAPLLDEKGLLDVYMLNTEALDPLAMIKVLGSTINKEDHEKMYKGWEKERDRTYIECANALNKHVVNTKYDYRHLVEYLLNKVTKKFVREMIELIESFIDNRYSMNDILDLEIELLSQESIEEDVKGRRRALRRVIKNLKDLLVNPNSGKQLSTWIKENVPKEEWYDWKVTKAVKAKSRNEIVTAKDAIDARIPIDDILLSTDAEAFSDYDYIEEIKPISTYKEYYKLASTYGSTLSKYSIYDPVHDRTYFSPNYSLCLTSTGRMSSFEPNFQNFPRRYDFRALWIPASPDRKLLCADFGQIELRIVAMLSQDKTMLKAYKDGIDLHKITAAKMARVDINDVTKEQRSSAKAVNFGLIYGAGAKTLQRYAKTVYKVEMTLDEAYDAVEDFRELYPGLREWQLKVSNNAEYSLHSSTIMGKLRRLREGFTYTISMNNPVQGTAAELMLSTLIKLFNGIYEHRYDAWIANCVHDEVLVDCHNDCITETSSLIKFSMEDSLLEFFPEASLIDLAAVGVGDNWNEAKV